MTHQVLDRDDAAVAGAVDRLSAEFAGRVGAPVVVKVVRGCRRELDGAPVLALPELVERLARERLRQSGSARR